METNIIVTEQTTSLNAQYAELNTSLNASSVDVSTQSIQINIIDNGVQGIKGASGKFEDLTPTQKTEIIDSIDTPVNYTNLFNSTLLS